MKNVEKSAFFQRRKSGGDLLWKMFSLREHVGVPSATAGRPHTPTQNLYTKGTGNSRIPVRVISELSSPDGEHVDARGSLD